MESTISPTELADRLDEVLDRVSDGERFVVELNGEQVATISPIATQPGITVAEFVAVLQTAPRPDPDFADDLEAIQAEQPPAEFPEWPD